MIATERLRQLLDARGVEWRGGLPTETVVDAPIDVLYVELPDGVMRAFIRSYLTPEQAVDATLGRGTCRDVCNSVSEFTCSACGFNCDLTSWISLFDGDEGRHRHHHHGTPHYCPNCGRKVES